VQEGIDMRTRPHPTRRPALAWGGAAVLSLALVAGCGGSGGLDESASSPTSPSGAASTPASASPAPSTATSSASPSATVDPVAAAVQADFRRYESGLIKSLHGRNDQQVDMIRYSTANRQDLIRSRIRQMHQQNVVFKGTPRYRLGDVRATGPRASLEYCEFGSASYYAYASTGKKAAPTRSFWIGYEIRMLQRDSRWQVDRFIEDKGASCRKAS
jgi:hypothetical protein